MTKRQDYFGIYYFMGMVLDVQEKNGQLAAAMPGVPAGYEIVFEPVTGETFRMRRGQLDGETAAFVRNEAGDVIAMRAGGFELVKAAPDAARELPITERLLAPILDLTPEKETAFAALFETHLAKADGGWVDYALPYPKHEFVQYVTAQDKIIFHGSNSAEIETFDPGRKSIELRDETGRGNLQAVYGTHNGLWSMFFAVVDRPKLRGSIRNGVMYFHNKSGEALATYNFSINQEQLPERPWREGTLYFLPRDSFVRLKMTEHAYANEWASEQAVKPLARLRIQPQDFPFLERIGGHDDGELIRLGTLSKTIRQAARRARLDEDGLTITLPAGLDDLDEYVQLQRTYMPAARFSITPVDGELILEISALPPAFEQLLRDEYADLLAAGQRAK